MTSEEQMVEQGIQHLVDALSVSKIVVTRSVKGLRGDSYLGFSVSFETIQDDAGGRGSDLISAQDGDVALAMKQGLSLKDARLASLLLGMQVDCAAHEQAWAGGNITRVQCDETVRAIKQNYTKLLADTLRDNGAE